MHFPATNAVNFALYFCKDALKSNTEIHSSEVTPGSHQSHSHSIPVSTDMTFSSTSPTLSTGNRFDDIPQGVCVCVCLYLLVM